MLKKKKNISRKKNFKSKVDFGKYYSGFKPGFALGGLWILIIILVFVGYEFWQGWKHSIWDGRSNLTFTVEVNNEISYVNINHELEEVNIINFPKNLLMPLAFGYGDYRVDKMKALAKLDKIDFGELLQSSMTQYLGVITDAYIVNSKVQNYDINSILAWTALKRAKTNMSSWDVIRVLMFTSKLRVEQFKQVDFLDTQAYELITLPDGAEVYGTKYEEFDNFVLKLFANPDFLADGTTWEIFNATNYDGLGAKVKRIVANSGFDVVGVRQTEEFYENSYIELREDNLTVNIEKFSKELGIPIKFTDAGLQRSQIKLVLGNDYWLRCCTRR